jgi:hypothetical protein
VIREHANAGDPIPRSSQTWRAILGAAHEWESGIQIPSGQSIDASGLLPSLAVRVRNDTGSALTTGQIVEISTPLVSSAAAPLAVNMAPFFAVIVPTGTSVVIGVAAEPIPVSGYGRIVVTGLCVAEVSMTAGHTYASPTATVARLTSSASAGYARIVYTPGGSGNLTCIVLLGAGWQGSGGGVSDAGDGVDGIINTSDQWLGSGQKRMPSSIITRAAGPAYTYVGADGLSIADDGIGSTVTGGGTAKLRIYDLGGSGDMNISANQAMEIAAPSGLTLNSSFSFVDITGGSIKVNGTTCATGTSGGGDTVVNGLVTTLGLGGGGLTGVSDTSTVDMTNTLGTVSADVITQMSITSDASGIMLSGDAASPGNSQYYGTDTGGTKGYHALPSAPSAATQAEMEAASSTSVYATPGRTQYHPGVAKWWVNFSVSTLGVVTVNGSHNIASVTRNGAGDFTIDPTTDMSSSANHAPIATASIDATGATFLDCWHHTISAGSWRLLTGVIGVGTADPAYCTACGFGDQ